MSQAIICFRRLWAVWCMKLSFTVALLSVWCAALVWMGGTKMVNNLGIEVGAACLFAGLLALAIFGALCMVLLGRRFLNESGFDDENTSGV